MERLTAFHKQGSYPVYVGNGIFGEALKDFLAGRTYDRIFLVTDSTVDRLYGELLMPFCPAGKFVFPASESAKSPETLFSLWKAMSDASLTRSSLVIALGGGVCSDLAGFAAATYLRSISYLNIPTTLLSQIDASVGGKTAVDLPSAKNQVGAFHQPCAVIVDSRFLATLPERVRRDGMGEAIKYAFLIGEDFPERLISEKKLSEESIRRCLSYKLQLVAEDEFDRGNRAFLNFGHTFGHAIEREENYSRFTHGEAVGLGMVITLSLGEKLGYPALSEKIRTALEAFGLPTRNPYPLSKLWESVLHDKKRSGDRLSMVMLDGIGSPTAKTLPLSEWEKLLREEN